MNIITKILGTTAALCALAITASAQFVSGPATGAAIDYTTAPFRILGSDTTNVAAAFQTTIPVGQLGVGFAITFGGTNSATTTNCTITFEGTLDGTRWIDAPTTALPVISSPQNGVTEYTFYTNMQATAANLGGIRSLRVKSIQNTNLATIWITNFLWSVKQ